MHLKEVSVKFAEAGTVAYIKKTNQSDWCNIAVSPMYTGTQAAPPAITNTIFIHYIVLYYLRVINVN